MGAAHFIRASVVQEETACTVGGLGLYNDINFNYAIYWKKTLPGLFVDIVVLKGRFVDHLRNQLRVLPLTSLLQRCRIPPNWI